MNYVKHFIHYIYGNKKIEDLRDQPDRQLNQLKIMENL